MWSQRLDAVPHDIADDSWPIQRLERVPEGSRRGDPSICRVQPSSDLFNIGTPPWLIRVAAAAGLPPGSDTGMCADEHGRGPITCRFSKAVQVHNVGRELPLDLLQLPATALEIGAFGIRPLQGYIGDPDVD